MLQMYLSYPVCLNSECPKALECLHNTTYNEIKGSQGIISVVNPQYSRITMETIY